MKDSNRKNIYTASSSFEIGEWKVIVRNKTLTMIAA